MMNYAAIRKHALEEPRSLRYVKWRMHDFKLYIVSQFCFVHTLKKEKTKRKRTLPGC